MNKVEMISDMVSYLPENEQTLVFEFVKRIVLAWDPDFTKLTPEEEKELNEAREQIKNGEYYSLDDDSI